MNTFKFFSNFLTFSNFRQSNERRGICDVHRAEIIGRNHFVWAFGADDGLFSVFICNVFIQMYCTNYETRKNFQVIFLPSRIFGKATEGDEYVTSIVLTLLDAVILFRHLGLVGVSSEILSAMN